MRRANKCSAKYIARVRQRKAERLARRGKIAEDFRGQLLSELGNPPALSAAQSGLIESAVLAFLQISDASEQFLRGHVRVNALARAGLARSELRRALRDLGLVGRDEGASGDGPPPGLTEEERREWSRRYVATVLAEAKSV